MSRLTFLVVASAIVGSSNLGRLLAAGSGFRIGVTSAAPHDPERLRKARER